MIKQLKAALQPCVFDVELGWGGVDTTTGGQLCQTPRYIPPLYDGTR